MFGDKQMKRIIALLPLLIVAALFVSCAKNKEVSEPAQAVKTEKNMGFLILKTSYLSCYAKM